MSEGTNLKEYWSNEGTFQDKANFLEKYLPNSGPSEYVETELFRAASKIYYDLYNNGFGNRWEAVIEYIIKHNHTYKNAEGQILNIDDHIIEFLQICSVGVIIDGDSLGSYFLNNQLSKQSIRTFAKAFEKEHTSYLDFSEAVYNIVNQLVDDILQVILLIPETWISLDNDMWETPVDRYYSQIAREYDEFLREDEEEDDYDYEDDDYDEDEDE